MADKVSTIKTIFALDGETQYSEAIKQINNEQKTLRGEMAKINAAYQLNGDKVKYNKDKIEVLNKQIENQRKKVNEARNAVEQSTAKTGEASAETQRYKNDLTRAETELMRLEKKQKDATTALAEATREMERAGKRAEEFGQKMQNVGGKIKGAGDKMSKFVSGPIAAIGYAAQKAFEEVDKSMDGIATATGATGETLTGLQDSFKRVVGDMPVEMDKVSAAIGELNTQFGTTGKTLEDQTRLTVEFAQITGSDVSSAVIGAKKAIEVFGASTEDYGRILDVVARQSQNTGVDAQKLFDTIRNGGPTLSGLGLTIEESVVLLSRMEQSGVDASKVVGALGKAQVKLADDGKSLNQGLAEFSDLVKSGASETDKMQAAADLFGTKGAVTMLDAVKRGTLGLDDLASAASEASGTVSRTFEATLDPIDKQKIALNNAKIAGAELSQSVQIALAPVMESLTGIMKDVATGFSEMDEKQRGMIVNAGLIAAAIGPVMSVGGRLIEGTGHLVSGWGKLVDKLSMAPGVIGDVTTKLGAGGTLGLIGAVAGLAIGLSSLIGYLTDMDPVMERARAAAEKLDNATADITAEYQAQTTQIDLYTQKVEELAGKEGKTLAEKALLADAVERLNTLMPDLNLAYDQENDKLNMTTAALREKTDAVKENLLEEAKAKIRAELMEAEQATIVELIKKQMQLTSATEAQAEIEEAVAQARASGLTDDIIRRFETYSNTGQTAGARQRMLAGLTDDQRTALENLNDVQAMHTRHLIESGAVTEGWALANGNAMTASENLKKEVKRLGGECDFLQGQADGVTERLNFAGEAMDKVGSSAKDTAKKTDEATERLKADASAAWQALKSQKENSVSAYGRMGAAADDLAKKQDEQRVKMESATGTHVQRINGFSKNRLDYETATVAELIALEESKLDAYLRYEENFKTVSGRVSKETADRLRAMGDEAAPLIAKLATASDAELSKLDDIFRRQTKAAVNAAKSELGGLSAAGYSAGAAYGKGLEDGLNSRLYTVRSVGGRVAGALDQAARERLSIRSPSRKGMEVGENYDKAIALGVYKNLSEVDDAGGSIADTLMDASSQLNAQVGALGQLTAPRIGISATADMVEGRKVRPSMGADGEFPETSNAGAQYTINVTVPYGENEQFGRTVGRLIAAEMRNGEFSLGG